MALVACMALCSLPVPLTIPVIPAHTPLPAICAQEAPKAIDLGVCVKWAAKDIGPEADIPALLSCRAPWFSFPSPKHALELVSCCFQNELIPRYSKMHLSLSKNRSPGQKVG